MTVLAEGNGEGAPNDGKEAPPEPTVPERPIPDFDGREEHPTVGQRLLWVPRVLFAPLYLVSEFVLRRPLVWLATRTRSENVPDRLRSAFRFGARDQVLLLPKFLVDFGFRTSGGFIFRYEGLGHGGLNLSADFAVGGANWIDGGAGLEFLPQDLDWTFTLGTRATKRPDGRFQGVASEASEQNDADYDWVGYDVVMGAKHQFWKDFELAMETGYRHREFGADVGSDTTIPELVNDPDSTVTDLPVAFDSGYDIWRTRVGVALDTRPERPQPLTGFQVGLALEGAADLTDRPQGGGWITYEGDLSGHWDFTGDRHVISLQLWGAVADAIRGAVPFTELPDVGGAGPMRGFTNDLVIGPSAAATVASYHWPIWHLLDGTVQLAVGNAFEGTFDDFAMDNLRLSFVTGFAAIFAKEHVFEMLVGFGTEPIADGTQIEDVRFTVGVRGGGGP